MLKAERAVFQKRIVRSAFFFTFAFFFILPLVFALKVPPRPKGYVNDHAGFLSPSIKAQLENVLRTFDEKTSNQIVVATFPSLEGESLEDFSMRLAEAWKAGQAKKDNGVIFLIFKDDRKMRIEVGYGLEGVLTDALSGQIIREVVAPYFRRGDYSGGIEAGVSAIMKATQGEFKGVPHDEHSSRAAKLLFLFAIVFLFHLFVRSQSTRIGRHGGGFYTPMGGGFRGRSGSFGGFRGGGGGFGGGGASGGW
jgi:uncharacterized protein